MNEFEKILDDHLKETIKCYLYRYHKDDECFIKLKGKIFKIRLEMEFHEIRTPPKWGSLVDIHSHQESLLKPRLIHYLKNYVICDVTCEPKLPKEVLLETLE